MFHDAAVPGEDGHEDLLFALLAALSVLVWLMLTVCTLGLVWPLLVACHVLALPFRSALVARLRGDGVLVGPAQRPLLYACLEHCCARLGLTELPQLYVLPGGAGRRRPGARFLGRHFLVLPCAVVDALDGDEEALRFYVGHELGQIAGVRPLRRWWLAVMAGLPLLGAAHARAGVYRCDRLGLACCNGDAQAASAAGLRALAVLAAGGRGARAFDPDAYSAQADASGGFWMSLNELLADRPWLCKRMARLRHGAGLADAQPFPRRHALAWLLAALLPRRGRGLLGGLFMCAYAGVLLAVLVSLVQAPLARRRQAEHQTRLASAYQLGRAAADDVASYLAREHRLPATVAAAGFDLGRNGVVDAIDVVGNAGGALVVRLGPPLRGQRLYLAPGYEHGALVWRCRAGGGIAAGQLPPGCLAPGADE